MLSIDDVLEEDKIKQKEKRATGRPTKLIKAEKKVATYLTESEYEAIALKAESEGLCLSLFLKQLIKAEILSAWKPKNHPKNPVFLKNLKKAGIFPSPNFDKESQKTKILQNWRLYS